MKCTIVTSDFNPFYAICLSALRVIPEKKQHDETKTTYT